MLFRSFTLPASRAIISNKINWGSAELCPTRCQGMNVESILIDPSKSKSQHLYTWVIATLFQKIRHKKRAPKRPFYNTSTQTPSRDNRFFLERVLELRYDDAAAGTGHQTCSVIGTHRVAGSTAVVIGVDVGKSNHRTLQIGRAHV